MSFQNLSLNDKILRAITEKGYTTPTAIQEQSIPIILQGKDLLGCAQTGTGKTAAFAIPILQILGSTAKAIAPTPQHHDSRDGRDRRDSSRRNNRGNESKRFVRGLILSPTRELALQIGENLREYGKYTGLTSTVICGGLSRFKQIKDLQRGMDILVATPGRLMDLMQECNLSLSKVEVFVLDEADRMLDMGFIDDIMHLISKLPKSKQTLFFSATMEPEIAKLANTILVNPERVTVKPVSSTAAKIEQFVYFVNKDNKNNLLLETLQNEAIQSLLVFTKTKSTADKLIKVLDMNKISCDAIHGDKSQASRQHALLKFKNKGVKVLVATDIAARGIDIDHLEFVLNYDLPNVAETYVHRIGRTGRAGKSGTAISFCSSDERLHLKKIEKLINKKIHVLGDAGNAGGGGDSGDGRSSRSRNSGSANKSNSSNSSSRSSGSGNSDRSRDNAPRSSAPSRSSGDSYARNLDAPRRSEGNSAPRNYSDSPRSANTNSAPRNSNAPRNVGGGTGATRSAGTGAPRNNYSDSPRRSSAGDGSAKPSRARTGSGTGSRSGSSAPAKNNTRYDR